MLRNAFLRVAAATAALAACLSAAPFGRVIPLGGHAADLALDEARGVLYVANLTANRVDVVSLGDGALRPSINVGNQPSSLSVSPNGRWLLVAHYGPVAAPATSRNSLTLVDLDSRARQQFPLAAAPFGVAFTADNRALVVTASDFQVLDPATGVLTLLETIQGVTAKVVPVPLVTFPPQITSASVAASGDRTRVIGLTDTFEFVYDAPRGRVAVVGYTSAPPQGPRVVSMSRDGMMHSSGWTLYNSANGKFSQFPNPRGDLNLGSHVIDSDRGLLYAQIPTATTGTAQAPAAGAAPTNTTAAAAQPPVLQVLDADNLNVRERLSLAENLAGKSVLSSDGETVYAISDSGVTILPVGALDRAPRVAADREDVVFRSNNCERRPITQDIVIADLSGNRTDFALSTTAAGVSFSPSSGVTPRVVRVTLDPAAYANEKGTVTAEIALSSRGAVNLPAPLRLVVNLRDPDQRGAALSLPGRLVDLLADPVRDRFYVLRQDRNQVLVFNGSNLTPAATLRTGNTPTQLALTLDRRHLMVGHDNSQFISVFDLDTLQESEPVLMPSGHYPRSIASSGSGILAANRVAGPIHKIDLVHFDGRRATELPTLGVFSNNIHVNTTLVESPNGSSILAAAPDGNVLLYSQGNFAVSRKDFTALAGAYAASSLDQFVVGNVMLNASLVPVRTLESGGAGTFGFAFLDGGAVRATSASATSAGVLQRVDMDSGAAVRPTRILESPAPAPAGFAFTRTLAPLANRAAMVALTVSGLTVLPFEYDLATTPPRIDRVINAADGSTRVAPGGLVSILGDGLSPVSQASVGTPLPTALGDSCLQVNGLPVPFLFVSPSQINAQLPVMAEGNVTMVLRTPGGVSDNVTFTINPGAPGVFRSGQAGDMTDLPTIVRARNGELVTPSNPVRRNDLLVFYLTGLGRTEPTVADGMPAPASPLANVLLPPRVTLGGVEARVLFAGLVPGQVGVYQMNVQVPTSVPTGLEVPLTVSQGGSSTTLAVRVVEER